jgi:hypothetical protein
MSIRFPLKTRKLDDGGQWRTTPDGVQKGVQNAASQRPHDLVIGGDTKIN